MFPDLLGIVVAEFSHYEKHANFELIENSFDRCVNKLGYVGTFERIASNE